MNIRYAALSALESWAHRRKLAHAGRLRPALDEHDYRGKLPSAACDRIQRNTEMAITQAAKMGEIAAATLASSVTVNSLQAGG